MRDSYVEMVAQPSRQGEGFGIRWLVGFSYEPGKALHHGVAASSDPEPKSDAVIGSKTGTVLRAVY